MRSPTACDIEFLDEKYAPGRIHSPTSVPSDPDVGIVDPARLAWVWPRRRVWGADPGNSGVGRFSHPAWG